MSSEQPVAAMVDGVEIYEADITSYIEGFRNNDEQCETDAGWAQYLTASGYTAETMRRYVIDTVFIPKVVVRNSCDSLGISVRDEELDDVIAKEKAYYENHYGAGTWDSVLSSYGYDEASWRLNEEDRLLEEKLRAEVVGEMSPDDSQVQAYASEHAVEYNGRHSYYLVFDEKEKAESAAAALQQLGDQLDVDALRTVAREASAAEPADAGWSSLLSTQDELSQTYLTTLNTLKVGKASDAFEDDGGKWTVIFCDNDFVVEQGSYLALSQIPAPILSQLKADAASALEAEAFEEWLAHATEQAEISVSAMPEGLPYDVNVSLPAEEG